MATWLVTGANRGIGLELVRQLRARKDQVFATCRESSKELAATGATAGVLVPDDLSAFDAGAIARQYAINAIGPLRVTAALLDRLGEGAKIGLVSSRSGSIGDGPGGGLYGYRMSKAALNMLGANLARDLAGRGILVAVLHPGFVRTGMTNGAGNDDPPVAASGLIARMDQLTPETSGHFFHANGQELPW
jgi:NAD(P)-dependent dehydrogenase (short-subunit alcohol dehydrogenase family)